MTSSISGARIEISRNSAKGFISRKIASILSLFSVNTESDCKLLKIPKARILRKTATTKRIKNSLHLAGIESSLSFRKLSFGAFRNNRSARR